MSALGRYVVGMGVGRFFPKGTSYRIGSGTLTMCTVGFGRVLRKSNRELLGTFAFHQGVNRFGDLLRSFEESLSEASGQTLAVKDVELQMDAVLSASNTFIPANEIHPELEDSCSTLALASGCELAFGIDSSAIVKLSSRKGWFSRDITISVDEKCVARVEEE